MEQQEIQTGKKIEYEFKLLKKYGHSLQKPARDIVGRDEQMEQVMAALNRPELSNVMLIAAAGTGKTALVQGIMLKDRKRVYLEIDLAKMIADVNDANQMAAKLKKLFDEAELYSKSRKKELVLFIDEFHQIVSLSEAAAEALKPMLADSGVRGIKVIAATTTEEFIRYIKPNLPLQERLQRINLGTLDNEATVAILRNMAEKYQVIDQFPTDLMFYKIVEYTNRYIPASVQPRKAIKILDSMIGWHRTTGRKLDTSLLADVLFESENVTVDVNIDAKNIKEQIDRKVFAQQWASKALTDRLYISATDFNNPEKPRGTFLFSGATGVGKTEMAKTLAGLLFGESEVHRSFIRMDMTEYSNSDSLNRFREVLTNKVWAKPSCVILLDEIEKACGEVTRLLLQVLDDGRLIDSNNREVTFKDSYIILTTNAGSEIYSTLSQYNPDDDGAGRELKKYNKLIRASLISSTGANRFPPELINRIGAIIPFQPLSETTQNKIATVHLKRLADMAMKRHGVRVDITKEVLRYVVQEKYDTQTDSGGARGIISVIDDEVTAALAKYIHLYPEVKHLRISVDGNMMIDNKNQLESAATIKIVAIQN